MKGIIFDIKQFAVFDGPGIRTTVFLKGCPLRCMWCHNPEGLSFQPQLMVSQNGCTHCGACKRVCKHPDHCVLCGECVRACPNHLRRICGTMMSPVELTDKLLREKDFLNNTGGGITFSGGEPAAQPQFLLECLQRLNGQMHRTIETSGYCAPPAFADIIRELDYIIMDIKLVDDKKHQHYTGVSNERILENLDQVKACGKPFRIRIPVIPGVNDDPGNFEATAALVKGAENLEFIELLPYHKTAGAKYGMVGKAYAPEFDVEREPNLSMEPFERLGVPCRKI